MEKELKCPSCGATMQKIRIERTDVTIDKCPSCLGIWLDRGELEKINRKNEKFPHIVLNYPG